MFRFFYLKYFLKLFLFGFGFSVPDWHGKHDRLINVRLSNLWPCIAKKHDVEILTDTVSSFFSFLCYVVMPRHCHVCGLG